MIFLKKTLTRWLQRGENSCIITTISVVEKVHLLIPSYFIVVFYLY